MNCTCPHLMLGSERLAQKNWNPDCPEHGVESHWWNSEEEQAKRQRDLERRRELQRLAREKREQQ